MFSVSSRESQEQASRVYNQAAPSTNEIELLRNRLSNKDGILKHLEGMPIEELWGHFLKNQVNLFFDQEVALFCEEAWWLKAENVLDIGSGNGEFLGRLASTFENKTFIGIEKKPESVESAIHCYQGAKNLSFRQGNAEELEDTFVNKYDVVIFRLTLQHLQHPLLAIEHACRYLKPSGCLLISDACDAFRKCSHQTLYLDEAVKFLNSANSQQSTGNRSITIELLSYLRDSGHFVGQNFDLVSTNLDENKEPVSCSKQMLWANLKERTLYFNHVLHFLEILKKGQWKVPVDSSAAYDEMKIFLDSEQVNVRPGQHVMVLRKKD